MVRFKGLYNEVFDANGNIKYALFGKNIKANEWQELSLSLKNISLPAVLTDIYVVQDKEGQKVLLCLF